MAVSMNISPLSIFTRRRGPPAIRKNVAVRDGKVTLGSMPASIVISIKTLPFVLRNESLKNPADFTFGT